MERDHMIATLIEAAQMYSKVARRRGKVTKKFKTNLTAYINPLMQMQDDPRYGEIAIKTIETINYALAYTETRNQADLQRLVTAHNEGDVLINALPKKEGDSIGN